MSVFDADAEEAALAPPQLVIGGRTYRGRVLSRDELLPHAVVFGDKDATDEDKNQAEVALLRLMYRQPWWLFWRPDPVRQVMKLSPATLDEFRADFFGFLARMATPKKPNQRTSGRSLSPSTAGRSGNRPPVRSGGD